LRNLLRILIAGIFLLGTFFPGAIAHVPAEEAQVSIALAGQAARHMHEVQGLGKVQVEKPGCPVANAKTNGEASSHVCCPASCVADLAKLEVPVSPGWKGLPPYLPITGSLTDVTRHRLEHPPEY
jgi:hypothetical protein